MLFFGRSNIKEKNDGKKRCLCLFMSVFFCVKKNVRIFWKKKFIDIKKIGCAKSFVLIFFIFVYFFFDVYKKNL